MSESISSFILGAVTALITVAGSAFIQKRQALDSKRNLILDYQVKLYLDQIDSLFETVKQLNVMGSSLCGRTEPTDASDEEEILEARLRDENAAAAFQGLVSCLDALECGCRKMAAMGSSEVAIRANRIISQINEYLFSAASRAQIDGVFVAADFKKAEEQLQESIAKLIEQIHQELLFEEQSSSFKNGSEVEKDSAGKGGAGGIWFKGVLLFLFGMLSVFILWKGFWIPFFTSGEDVINIFQLTSDSTQREIAYGIVVLHALYGVAVGKAADYLNSSGLTLREALSQRNALAVFFSGVGTASTLCSCLPFIVGVFMFGTSDATWWLVQMMMILL